MMLDGDGMMSVLRNLLATNNQTECNAERELPFLLISDVAAKVELEPKTIRFYEKSGLVKPKRMGQLRVFSNEDVEVLQFIKKLRQYDMPIIKVREVLELHREQGDSGNRDGLLQNILKTQRDALLARHRVLAEHIAALNDSLSEVPDGSGDQTVNVALGNVRSLEIV
jgi:MerR family transcriptional regulator, repressor of the yfmOP operon